MEKAAFALDNGTATGSIKTDSGYYFIYCVNKFNEELTDANKIKIVQKREKAAFGDVYDAYSRTISKKSTRIHGKIWRLRIPRKCRRTAFFPYTRNIAESCFHDAKTVVVR